VRRWQIWAPVKPDYPTGGPVAPEWGAPPVQYAWQPYDPSSVQSTEPREDVENYFYLDIRYHDRDGRISSLSTPVLLFTSLQKNPI
jgi:hypothetical protein